MMLNDIPAGIIDQRLPESPFGSQHQGLQNRCDKMGRRNKIDIVASLVLQGEETGCQLLRCDLSSLPFPTDLSVLAKDTFQIAVGKENRTGTSIATQRLLFPEMGLKAGDNRLTPGLTNRTSWTIQPINLALSGT